MHSSWSSGSPPLLSRCTSEVDVVDVWGGSLLVVNEASHGLDGEEVEMPSLPRTILNVRSRWSPRFCFYGINSELPNR
jgi:hypothetical protein